MLGNFDACIRIKSDPEDDLDLEGRHSIVSISVKNSDGDTKTQNRWRQYSVAINPEDFATDLISLSRSEGLKMSKEALDDQNLEDLFETFINTFQPTTGICSPAACSAEDISENLNKLLNRVQVGSKILSASVVTSYTLADGEVEYNAGLIVFM